MIITAVYLYGMSQGSWQFNMLDATICFAADLVLVRVLSADIHVNVKSDGNTSEEEKRCWNKRTEVEELRRVELDRELYGKK